MNVVEAIQSRRSIRRFKPDPIDQSTIEQLLNLTVRTPSAKNEQPWRFVVISGDSKRELLERMSAALDEAEAQGHPLGSSRGSLRAMTEAPVIVLVYNSASREDTPERYKYTKLLVDTQSIGAAIQTFLLAAQSMGLGTLWICDVLYVVDKINSYVAREDELVAAIALGHPAESPGPRPRDSWQEVTTWLS